MKPPLPTIAELGRDLLVVSRRDVAVSLFRPLLCFGLFWPLALLHHYILAAVAVAGLLFFTYTSTSHDLVHKTLQLPEPVNEWLLAFLEALTFRSGHAFRLTHIQHHRRFPHDDDVEGAEPGRGFLHALACGPLHQFRLFGWAWAHGNAHERTWMAGEAVVVVSSVALVLLKWYSWPALSLYFGLTIAGSWLYPLATVWFPHRPHGATVLQQTIAVRGWLIPHLFFEHTYHLEHHLYPSVSSHRWQELGKRLEPFFRDAGVPLVKIP